MKLGKQQKEQSKIKNKKKISKEQEELLGVGAQAMAIPEENVKQNGFSNIMTIILLVILGILVGYLSSTILIDFLTKSLLELNI